MRASQVDRHRQWELLLPFVIYVLAAVNVAVGTQSFVFSGLLSEIAADLNITVGTAGLLVAASTIVYAALCPFAILLVADRERRGVLVCSLTILGLCNAIAAFAPSFRFLLAARLAGGVAMAFVGTLASGSVPLLVEPHVRGRAFAIVIGGMTVALVLGIPLGSVVGGVFGWRATFAYAAFVCLICTVLLAWGMPKVRPEAAVGSVAAALFRNHSIMHTLALTTIAFTSAFVIIPFLGPILQKLTGLQGAGIGGLQAFVGLGSFAGLAIGGIAADRRLHRTGLALSFLLIAVTALLYAYELDVPRQAASQLAAALLAFLLSVSLFSVIPINLSQLSQLAGPATPVALAVNSSLMSMGQGLGAIIGGRIGDTSGFVWLSIAAAGLSLPGLMLAISSRAVPRAKG
jgi:DHA1 family inner membrane transport protein